MSMKAHLRTLTVGANKAFRRELITFVLDPRTGALRLRRSRAHFVATTPRPRPDMTDDEYAAFIDELEAKEAGLDHAVFEVRQPSVEERAEIIRASGATPGDKASANVAKLQVAALIACTFEPARDEEGKPKVGGTTRLFDVEDTRNLLEQAAGSFVDVLGNKALELMNAAGEVGKG